MTVHSLQFKGEKPRGLGLGFVPRGIYKFMTDKVEVKGTKKDANKLAFYLNHKTTEAHIWDEEANAFVLDPKWVNQDIFGMLMFPDGQSDGGDKAREADIKAALISHGGVTREQIESQAGQVNIDTDRHFINRFGFLLFDPPPLGMTNEYPEKRYVDAATFAKIVSGETPVRWPWDGKRAKTGAGVAAGSVQTGAGAMLPPGAGGGLPTPTGLATLPGGPPPNGAGAGSTPAAAVTAIAGNPPVPQGGAQSW